MLDVAVAHLARFGRKRLADIVGVFVTWSRNSFRLARSSRSCAIISGVEGTVPTSVFATPIAGPRWAR
jgi:hypothetical protein